MSKYIKKADGKFAGSKKSPVSPRKLSARPKGLANRESAAEQRVIKLEDYNRFGPQSVHVRALAERVRQLTQEDVNNLRAAMREQGVRDLNWAADDMKWVYEDLDQNGDLGESAADAAVRFVEQRFPKEIDMRKAEDGKYGDLTGTIELTVRALVLRNHAGTNGAWSRSAYNDATRAWREAIGPIHPED